MLRFTLGKMAVRVSEKLKRARQFKSWQQHLKIGDIILIKGEDRNRGKRKIGIVDVLFPGRDGGGARVRVNNSHLQRPIQFLYPMELHIEQKQPCTRIQTTKKAVEAAKIIKLMSEDDEL